MVQLWERLVGETTQAFEAWVTYRDMREERSYSKVAAKLEKSVTIVSRWASRWAWQHRLEEFDRFEDRERLRGRVFARKKAEDKQAAVAGVMLSKAIEALMALDGKTLSPALLDRYIATAVKVERLALGLATEHIETEPAEESDPQVSALRELLRRDPDARRLALSLATRLLGQSAGPGQPQPDAPGDVSHEGAVSTSPPSGSAE